MYSKPDNPPPRQPALAVQAQTKFAVQAHDKCHDSAPGVCCNKPAHTCGLVSCEINAIRAFMNVSTIDRKNIQEYGCGGKTECCFYPANGGLYCQSCA